MKKSAKKSSQNKRVGSSKPKKTLLGQMTKRLVAAMAPKASKKPLTKKPSAPVKAAKTAPVKAASGKGPSAEKIDKKSPKAAAGKATPAAAPAKNGKKGKEVAAVAVVAPAAAGKAVKGAKGGKLGKEAKAPKEKSAAAIRAAEAAGEKLCREAGCENIATTKGYCRLDYIKNWKKIKRKEMILKEGKLNQYIEELVSKYPDKYIDIIRQDLSTEVNFTKIIHDLELDESIDDLEYDGDSIDSLIGAISKSSDEIDDGDF